MEKNKIEAFKVVLEYRTDGIAVSIYKVVNGMPMLPAVIEGEGRSLEEIKGIVGYGITGIL